MLVTFASVSTVLLSCSLIAPAEEYLVPTSVKEISVAGNQSTRQKFAERAPAVFLTALSC